MGRLLELMASSSWKSLKLKSMCSFAFHIIIVR